MKTWTLKVNEDELKALIKHHTVVIFDHENPTPEHSSRLHDLVKRLNKDTPEIEQEVDNTKKEPETQASDKVGW